MITSTTGRGIAVRKLHTAYSPIKNFVLTSNCVIGERNYIAYSGFTLSRIYSVDSGEWKEPFRDRARRYGNRWYREVPKRYDKIYAQMDTEDEAIQVAEIMHNAKIGTHDFKLRLALVSDEILAAELA